MAPLGESFAQAGMTAGGAKGPRGQRASSAVIPTDTRPTIGSARDPNTICSRRVRPFMLIRIGLMINCALRFGESSYFIIWKHHCVYSDLGRDKFWVTLTALSPAQLRSARLEL